MGFCEKIIGVDQNDLDVDDGEVAQCRNLAFYQSNLNHILKISTQVAGEITEHCGFGFLMSN